MSNQIENPNVKMFSKTISYLSVNTQVVWFTVQGSASPLATEAASLIEKVTLSLRSHIRGLFQFSSVNLDGFVKSRHSGENRSPETL